MMGFNVGMNIGLCAGQTILWPHIHFIPRNKDDYEGDGQASRWNEIINTHPSARSHSLLLI